MNVLVCWKSTSFNSAFWIKIAKYTIESKTFHTVLLYQFWTQESFELSKFQELADRSTVGYILFKKCYLLILSWCSLMYQFTQHQHLFTTCSLIFLNQLKHFSSRSKSGYTGLEFLIQSFSSYRSITNHINNQCESLPKYFNK